MTEVVGFVQSGEPVVLDFVHTEPPIYVVDPPPPTPLLTLDSLADVADAVDGDPGDVLTKDLDGQWRPASAGAGGGGGSGYHHVQLAASESWVVFHGLGFNPSGIVVHDSIGDIVEPADVVYVNASVLRLLFTNRPMSGTADVS